MQLPAISAVARVPSHMSSWIQSNLASGPLGVLALTAIASLIQVPITQYKTLYSISVGYGYAVALIGYVVLRQSSSSSSSSLLSLIDDPATLLAYATIAYGLRLGTYLLWREYSQPSRRAAHHGRELSRPKRFGLALTVSVLYACMTTPLLYAMRAATLTSMPQRKWKRRIAYLGAIMAWTGTVTQAVADGHKHHVKSTKPNTSSKSTKPLFVGPTQGLYRITRHPNYTAELLFWVGLYVSGMPCFGTSVVGWMASSLGVASIVSIMMGATKRLEQRQQESYGGQAMYERWKVDVPSTLIPFVRDGAASR
jgi:steroid 5-alpha reductase family enzyme